MQRPSFRGIDHYRPNALVTLQHPRPLDLCRLALVPAISSVKRALGIDPGESDEARWHALGDARRRCCARTASIANDLYSVLAFLARTQIAAAWRSRWRICSA